MAIETVSPQAEQAGEIAQAAVAQAENQVAAVIEQAAVDLNAATETAEQIAQASVATDLGGRISQLDERMAQWRSEQQAQLMEIQEENRMIQDGLTEALNRLASALTPAPPTPAPPVSTPTPGNPEEPPPNSPPANADGPPEAPINQVVPRKPARRAI